MEELIQKVIKWAEDRNLIYGTIPERQIIKTLEEVTELTDAIIKGRKEEVVDGIGDVTVTLIIIARQCGLDFEGCLKHAYNEIKDRKGKMIDGIFVKEE